EFSRKSFLKGGGALVIGFGVATTAGKAQAATGNTPFTARTGADFLPDLNSVDAWLAITPDNRAIVTHGETEMGHGTPTGILQLVAEELDMNMSQMVYAHPESWLNATGGGGGSGGISSRSTQARAAGAYARQILLGLASTQLGVPVANLTVADGVVSGGGKTVTYGALMGGKVFSYVMPIGPTTVSATSAGLLPGAGIAKPVSSYKVVGKSFPRIDIPAKVAGTYTYIHNVRIPGMIHARTVRPRGAGANTAQNHIPLSVDASSIAHIPGAQVVQIANFLAVAAPKEYDAIQAASQLKVVWKSDPKLPGSGNFWGWLRNVGDTNTANPARFTTNNGPVDASLATSAKTVSATYAYDYNGFMPIGPHCAVADVKATSATLYVQGQSLQGIPPNIATMLGFASGSQVRVIWYEGASSFGGGHQGEAAEQAAIISQKVGKPVRLQWMRWDQHGWDHYGMANLWDVKMGIDSTGKIVAADWTTYGQQQANIDTTKELLGTATWPAVPGSGGLAPTDTVYMNTTRRVNAKTQPLYGGALKCNFLRAPSAPQQYFASEQIVDELAHAANMDPIAFRRLNIDPTTTTNQRWLAALDASTMAAGWKPKVAGSNVQSGNIVTGRGFAFGTFASTQMGMVVDIEVNKKTGKIVAKHMYIAQNNGITVSPQLVGNQMSGAAIQGLSRALLEKATFNKERITSLDWVTYPILRIADAPHVTLVNAHPGIYTAIDAGSTKTDVTAGNTAAAAAGWLLTGSGEPPSAGVGAAVANAFFDATGVRIRMAPMNPATVRGTLRNAGVA
ncbi:MAG: molybdopterin cofactor-binding domain-containing protein, partial [Actinomycetes bacterium]